MAKSNIQTLKGFRDFLPDEARLRNYVRQVLVQVFEISGFQPLETPVLEYSSTLLNKYGQEADQLVYRFFDNGQRDVAMRYDLTVPTAKVLSIYQNEIKYPFKRYQIAPVWRADKPQAGRYREFVQADCDIYGPTSAFSDAEILIIVAKTLQKLKLNDFVIQVNSRPLLYSILDQVNLADNKNSILQSIDKLDKIGEIGVQKELIEKGLTSSQIAKLFSYITKSIPDENLQNTIDIFLRSGFDKSQIKFNPTIVRGLDYYTGLIFETIVPKVPIGSVASGGRYNNLIQSLGGPAIPAVGVGIGFDRLVDCIQKLNLYPKTNSPAKFLIANFDSQLLGNYLDLQAYLQLQNIPCFIYPQTEKLAKQIKYALDQNIPYLLVQGSNEAQKDMWQLKNLTNQNQTMVAKEELLLI